MRILYFVSVVSSSSSSFFARLFSAAADWMSPILPHMMWPQCEFRMQVWNVLNAARWIYRTQKLHKKLPYAHHRTNSSGYISSQLRHILIIGKHLLNSRISSTCSHNMVNVGPLAAEISSRVWGTPANFNGFCVLASLLHRRWGWQKFGVLISLFRFWIYTASQKTSYLWLVITLRHRGTWMDFDIFGQKCYW